MSVDGERRDPFLAMGRQRRGQIDRPRTLGAVKAPDGLRAQRIHVDGFAAVAPAGGDGDGDADVLAAEFLFTGGRLGHAGDAGIGNHALHPAPQAWRSFSLISAAVAFAMFMVCASSDSRTPMRRPSITGRIPIFGKLIFSLQIPQVMRITGLVRRRL